MLDVCALPRVDEIIACRLCSCYYIQNCNIQISPRLASLHTLGSIITVAQTVFSTTKKPVKTGIRLDSAMLAAASTTR